MKKPGGILAGHDFGDWAFVGMFHGVLDFVEELFQTWCAMEGAAQGKESDAAAGDLQVFDLSAYCRRGITLNLASDYIYWIQF